MRVLAVDIGATRLRVAFFQDEKMIWKREMRTPREGGHLAVAKAIVDLAPPDEPVDIVSVASIGPLDLKRGWVVNTPNNPIGSFALRDPLVEVYKVPVIVINDCVAAAWGEYVLSRRGVSNLLYVTISSGIGGGVVVDGNLLLGKSGNAHEIGHMVVDHTSEVVCGCGGRGHWEALAGGANVPKVARIKALKWKGKETRALQLAKTGSLDAPLLYSLARNGDQFAISLVNEMNRVHSAGLASAIAAYDPEVVVLGGGVVLNNQDLMLRPIAERLKEYLSLSLPSLEVSGFGDNAVLYGALAIALRPPKSLEAFGKV